MPTYRVSGSDGSMTIELIAMLLMRSARGHQIWPPSVVFHTPPETPPVYMMSGFAGWMISDRVRPPMFPGPSGSQPPNERSAGQLGVPNQPPAEISAAKLCRVMECTGMRSMWRRAACSARMRSWSGVGPRRFSR